MTTLYAKSSNTGPFHLASLTTFYLTIWVQAYLIVLLIYLFCIAFAVPLNYIDLTWIKLKLGKLFLKIRKHGFCVLLL